jgi:xanthine dehydrogenase accessory factor
VKQWQETSGIIDLAARLAQAGRQAAVATVVRIEGSAYRRPGAKMLVAEDGAISGSASDGCLEADVREVALSVIRSATPRLLHYNTGADDQYVWGLGFDCNGSVDIFVQPATSALVLERAAHIAELLAVRSGREARYLRERASAIHAF